MDLLDELLAVNARGADAISRGDARAAAQEFTADGAVIVADTPTAHGHDELETLFRSWIDAGMTRERFAGGQAEVLGDGALLICSYEAEIRQAGGGPQIERGKNLQVFKRDDSGQWKIRALGITTDSA